ncbi:UNVERIFIED_CONTAM: hypothetical protein Sangu_0228700 [Sesamum angustifolium]|uniref:Reverse transcriptase zinc-binding domain-containing protein n=1 Tax=Sesamum angustifolium TaxID=2727405 RepID=A0AAW2RNL4_9LAMI
MLHVSKQVYYLDGSGLLIILVLEVDKALKPVFRQQRRNKGDLAMNVKLAAGFLEVAQKLLQFDRQSLLLQLEHCCRLVYLKATKLEHVMLRQRAKLQWLKGGDQCSKVFFRRVTTRRANKRIFQISDNMAMTDRVLDLHYLRPWARHILTEEEARALIRPVTIDDVKTAMFDIEEDKAPGPDGFSSGFYKAAKPIVGEEISKTIMDFFNTSWLLKQVNATLLTLIPKCRLPPRCALKVDLRKAYDTVEWDFLFATLRMFGFPAVFIRWIEECVTSAHFSIYVNGGVHGFFAGARGLRQARLSIADCQPLLQKIDSRIKEWEGIQLSFVGRVQLIKSVLVSLECYPKVAWEVVWKPVEEGGQGDGNSFSLWHDPWHPLGPLIIRFPRGPQLTNTGLLDKLNVVLANGQWNWLMITGIACLEITQLFPPISEGTNRISWKSNDGSFTTSAAYALFHPPGPKLAILGRLSTLDKPWLHHIGGNCILCSDGFPETHDHLYFACSFARRCLTIIRRQIPLPSPHHDWQRGILWASSRWRGKHVVNAAYRSLLASLVYHLWQERNSRRFQQRSRPPSIVGALVVEEIRQKIISVHLRQSVSTCGLYRLWKIPWPVEGDSD